VVPNFGDFVTVRALVNMPGVDDGMVKTVEWGPRLAKLVRLGRYEIVEQTHVQPAAEPPADLPPGEETVGAAEAPTTKNRSRGR
jgi:hypothetical protein